MTVIIKDCFWSYYDKGEFFLQEFEAIENAKGFLLELLGHDIDFNDYEFIEKDL